MTAENKINNPETRSDKKTQRNTVLARLFAGTIFHKEKIGATLDNTNALYNCNQERK